MATISGLNVFLALSFSLALMAVVSLILFARDPLAGEGLSADPPRLRIFKRERASVVFSAAEGKLGWYSLVDAEAQNWRGVEMGQGSKGRMTLVATHAGRYVGVELRAVFVDLLGLYEKRRIVRTRNFVAEVLPLSLLATRRGMGVSAMALGDTPAGTRGRGQEFYGIEEYAPSTETRDILWKRTARSPEEKLQAKVKEASVPEWVRVGLIPSTQGGSENWMDLASEALGQVGRSLLDIGVGLEVLVQTADGIKLLSAKNMTELVELVIDVWSPGPEPYEVDASILGADFLLIGSTRLTERGVLRLTDYMPSIVISEGGETTAGTRAHIFSGTEDLHPLVSTVVVS